MRLDLIDGSWHTLDCVSEINEIGGALEPVFIDGAVVGDTFEAIRERACNITGASLATA